MAKSFIHGKTYNAKLVIEWPTAQAAQHESG